MASIAWLSWSAETFERARAEAKPVLLFVSAAWCHWCREMDRTSYADPVVARIVSERFVPIRIDADRRPDIADRYSLGGLPTTAFLTPDGEVAGGGTYVPPGRMVAVLERVVDAFARRGDELAARTGVAPTRDASPAAPEGASADALIASIYRSFDAARGGFGIEPKFPLTAPLHLALDLYRGSSDPSMSHIVESTLDAMGWGGLYDEVDGGFFRYATTRDWQLPHQEKLLDVNAALLKIYVEAAEVLQVARYRDRSLDVLRYVQTSLADPVDGGWAGSQQADATYYAGRTAEARREAAPPAVDRALYTGWNASMAAAALQAAAALDEPPLADFAIKSLERVLLACYRPGAGVAHYFDGEAHVRDLLDDQIAVAAASLDAYEASGNIVYEMMAEELALFAIRTMWDEQAGGFFDRAPVAEQERVGLLSRRLKPFVANCEAARLLRRVAASSGEQEFARRADATLAFAEPLAWSHGPLAAHYVLALRENG